MPAIGEPDDPDPAPVSARHPRAWVRGINHLGPSWTSGTNRTGSSQRTLEAVPAPAHAHEALARAVHRRDQPAADRELLLQRRGTRSHAAAATLMASNGACSGSPSDPVADHERHVVDAGRRQAARA